MKKIQLHKPHGKNSYCGPTAISALTGISKDDVAAIVRKQTGRPSVKGMHTHEAVHVLNEVGCGIQILVRDKAKYHRRPTLAKWMEDRTPEQRELPMLVEVTGHYVAVLRDTVVCSMQGGEARNILSARCARMEFRRAIVLRSMPAKGCKLPEGMVKLKAVEKSIASHNAKMRRAAHALAKGMGLKIEPYMDHCLDIVIDDAPHWCNVLGEILVEGEDPTEALTDIVESLACHDGWSSVIDRLEQIRIECPGALK